eukprot:gene30890-37328_t
MSFPTSFNSSDLVLGLAFDIDAAHLAIFSYSLRKHAPNAVVILFINFHVSEFPKIQEVLTDTRVLCVYVEPASLTPKFIRTFHPSSLRWILYDRLLNSVIVDDDTIVINQDEIDKLYIYLPNADEGKKENLSQPKTFMSLFTKIIALDVRDSVFQSDPFLLLPEEDPKSHNPPLVFDFRHSRRHSLFVFAEDASLPLGQCGWNSGWVRDCFGDDTLTIMTDNTIICSGVSMGYVDVMHVYIHYMSLLLRGQKIVINPMIMGREYSYNTYNYLNNEKNAAAINNYAANGLTAPFIFARHSSVGEILAGMHFNLRFPQCERNGVDQGMHNVLISLNLIPAKICDHSNFPVINLQSAMEGRIFLHEDKRILLPRARKSLPYAIVHQYDRYDSFQKDLVDTYIPWINTSDPLRELQTNPTCSPYKRLEGLDMMKGKCDLKAQNVLSIGLCCEMCYKMNLPVDDASIIKSNSTTSYEGVTCTGFIFDGQKCYLKKCTEDENFKLYTDNRMIIQYLADAEKEVLLSPSVLSFFLPFSKPEYVKMLRRLPFAAEYFGS